MIDLDGLQRLRTALQGIDVESTMHKALAQFADIGLAEASPSISSDGYVPEDLSEALRPIAGDPSARCHGPDGSRQFRGLDLDRGIQTPTTPSSPSLATDQLGPILAERIAETFVRLLCES